MSQENRPGGLLGAVLGDYRIQEEIGGEGGSQVFKAVSVDQSSIFAVKVFPAGITENKQVFQQLLQSLKTAARMDHPGIPRMIGSGMIAGRPYIAMSYLPSGSLRDRLEMGLLSLADLPPVLSEVASILTCAHSHGVVHGDLKPSEILFDGDGRMQLIGLGQALHWPIDSTSGPPPEVESYKAPEVLLGRPPTQAADQYSLALIALEISTGMDPRDALRLIRAGGVDRPRSATWQGRSRPSLPPRMIDVLQRATADDPAQRFPSVAHMERALLAALNDTPVPAASSSAESPTVDRPRRKRSLTFALLGTALALVVCLVTAFPAMSASGMLDFDLARYTSLLVEALSGESDGIPATIASPISLSGEPGSDGLPAEPEDGGGASTASHVEGGLPGTSSTPLPGDVGEAPTGAPANDTEVDTDAGQTDADMVPGPTSTPVPAYTPTLLSTNTPIPTAVPTETPVTVHPTNIPPTDQVEEPTINPNKCKSDPAHKNYCTPVP